MEVQIFLNSSHRILESTEIIEFEELNDSIIEETPWMVRWPQKIGRESDLEDETRTVFLSRRNEPGMMMMMILIIFA